jgi:hypothetical protein
MTLPLLPLERMHERHFGLTPFTAGNNLEAARVCLDRHYIPPQEFILSNDEKEYSVQVEWEQTDERTKGAWANVTDVTEIGAYACALAATELARGMVAVQRAETLTGVDYYIAPIGKTMEDLEECFRLEISGTHSDNSVVKTRLRDKVKQARKGDSSLPALAAVVGYRARLIMIQTVEETL